MIKTLRVVVPWSSLDRDSFKVIVEGVEIVLGPLRARPYSEDEEVNRSAAIKKKQSEMFEKARQSTSVEQHDQERYNTNAAAAAANRVNSSSRANSPRAAAEPLPAASPSPDEGAASPTPSAAKQSYADQIIASVVKNAHVILRDINISYTFDYEGLHPSLASSISLHVGELYFSTTDDKWTGKPTQKDTGTKGSMGQIRYITVKDFSVVLKNKRNGHYSPIGIATTSSYWSSVITLVENCDLNIFLQIGSTNQLGSAAESGGVEGGAQLSDHIVDIQIPPIKLNVSLDTVQIVADVAASLSQALDCTSYRKHLHFLTEPDSPTKGRMGPARARWRFCVAGVKSYLAEQRRDLSWSSIREFCVLRRDYVGLFKRQQHVAWLPELTVREQLQLDSFERKLRIDQLVLLRCLAYAELAVDQSANMTQRALLGQQSDAQSSQNKSWMNWLGYGRAKPISSPIVLLATTTTTFSVQEQKRMFVTNFFAEWLIGSQFLQSKHKIQQLPEQGERPHGFQISVDFEFAEIRIVPAHSFGFRPLSSDSPLLVRLKRLLASLKAELKIELDAVGGNFRLASSSDLEVPRHNVMVEVGRATASFSTSGRCVPLISMRDTSDNDSTTSPWLSVGSDSRRVDVLMSNCTIMLPLQHELDWWKTTVLETITSLRTDEQRESAPNSKDDAFTPIHLVVVNSCIGVPFSDPSHGGLGATIERAALAIASPNKIDVEVSSTYVDLWTSTSIHRMCQFDDVNVLVATEENPSKISVVVTAAEEVTATLDPHVLGMIGDHLLRPCCARQVLAQETGVTLNVVALHAQERLGGALVAESCNGQPAGASFDFVTVEEERSIVAGIFAAQHILCHKQVDNTLPPPTAAVDVSVQFQRGASVNILIGGDNTSACLLRISPCKAEEPVESEVSPFSIVIAAAGSLSNVAVKIAEARIFWSFNDACLLALSNVAVSVSGDELKNHTDIHVSCTKALACISPPLIGALETLLGTIATARPKGTDQFQQQILSPATQVIKLDVAESSVECMRTNTHSRQAEPLFVVTLSSTSVSVSDASSSSLDVAVLTAISGMERTDRDGKRFHILFPHSSGEPTLLKVVVRKPLQPPTDPSAQFSTFVSVQVANVAMAHYHAFLLRAADLSNDPIVDRLSRISEREQSIAGFSNKLREGLESTFQPPQLTGISVTVSSIEVFAAVDNYQQVDPGDFSTHVALRVPKVSVNNSITSTTNGFKFVATNVLVSSVHIAVSHNCFVNVVNDVQVIVTAGALCVADGDQYVLKPGDSASDSTIRVQLGVYAPSNIGDLANGEVANHSQAAVDISFSPLLLAQLLRVVAYNVLDPVGAAAELKECGYVPPYQAAQVLMLAIPSLRVVVCDEVNAFEISLFGGLQVYRAVGGHVWSSCPLQSVKLHDLVVVDQSSAALVIDRDVSKTAQKQRLAPFTPKPIISVSSIDVVIQGERDVKNMTPSSSTIMVTVGDVLAALLPRSIFTLRDLLANDITTPCLAVLNASTPLHPDAPPALHTDVVMHALVKIAMLKAELVEAWGSKVGTITGADLSIDVRQQVSEAQRVDINLKQFALAQHVTDPSLQTIVRSSPRTAQAETVSEFALSISVSIMPPDPSVERSSSSGLLRDASVKPPSTSRPCANFTNFVNVNLHGVDVVLVPHALLRVVSLIGEDLVPLSMIMLSPATRASAALSPSFEAASIVVEGTLIRVRVPCDCTGSEAAATVSHSYPSWILTVPTIHVSNRLSVVSVKSAAPNLSCWAETLTVEIGNSDLSLDLCQSLSSLARFDKVLVVVERPVPRAAFFTIERADTALTRRLSSSSNSTPTSPLAMASSKLYQIIPPTDLRVGNRHEASFLMQVSVSIALAQQHPIVITPNLLQQVVKTASMTSLIEPIPYYRTNDATIDIAVGISVSKLQVMLSNEDHEGSRQTILVLNIRDSFAVHIRQPYDPAAEVCTILKVEGSLDVSDYRGAIVLHRTVDRAQEQTSAIQLTMIDTPSPSGGQKKSSSSRMELLVRDLRAHLNDNAVDVALRVQGFVENLDKTNPSMTSPKATDAPPSATLSGILLVVLQNSRVHITETAVVSVAQASASVPLAATSNSSSPHDSASKLQIMLADVTLSRPGRSSSNFFSVTSADVKVGVGSIYVKAHKPHLINHDTYFFLELLQAVDGLQQYVAAHAKLSKKSEESFKHELVVSMVDLDFSLIQRHAPHDSSTTSSAARVATLLPRLTVSYPAVVLKLTDTSTSQDLSIEAEDGSMQFINPQSLLPVPPLCKGLSFTVRHCVNEKSASTSLSLGRITISVPVGTVQQTCTEIVAHALIPVTRFFKRAHGTAVLSSSEPPHHHHRSTSLEVFAPQISIYTVDTMQARNATVPLSTHHRMNFSRTSALAGTMDNVLFGVDIHQISIDFKSNERDGNESLLFKVYSISSVVNPNIQLDLLSTEAGSSSGGSAVGVGDPGPAIVLRRDVIVDTSAPLSTVAEIDRESPVEKRISIIAKVKLIRATISPMLLKLVNDNILAHVAIAVRNSREHHNQLAFSSPQRPQSSFSSSSSQLVGYQSTCIEITQDYTVKSDLVLGGSGGGSWLHFKKVAMDSGKPIDNVISFDGVNHATIYISHFDEDGSYGGPLSCFPIVVDEGLSVYCRNVRFVLQGTGTVLHDYLLVGSRSFFCLLDPHLVITPLMAGSGLHGSAAARQSAISLGISDVPRREALELTTVDIAVALNLSLWSAHQKITVSTAVNGAYRLLKSHVSASALLSQVVDEGGDVSLIDLTVVCDSGNITTEPTGLIVNIRHHRPKEAGVVVGKGTTIARCIIPNTRLSISLGHAKLLLDVFTAIQRGSRHISDMDEPAPSSFTGLVRDDSTPNKTNSALSSRDPRDRTNDRSASQSAASDSAIQAGLTAPLLELVLTNDFFIPIAVFSVTNTSVQIETERGMDSFALAACLTCNCYDYPTKDSSAPRQLLELSPEIAVDFNRFKNNGLAVDAKIAIPELTATIPIVTLLNVLDYEFAKQNTGSYSFRNRTGVYLTLFSTESDVASNTLYCVVPPEETVKADIFRYDQTVFRIVEGTPDEVGGKNLSAVGAEVDLSRVSSAASVPIHLDQQCNVSVTDIVLRLNEKERLVELTSCVTFFNDLSSSRVTLSFDGGETVVAPQSSLALPLQSLLHSFDLSVGACTRVIPNPMTIPPSPSLETLLGGFLIATEDVPSITGRNMIEIPVQLDSGEAERAAPRQSLSLVLVRMPLGTNGDKSVYEVRLRARIRLFNEVGVPIAVAIVADRQAAASISNLPAGGQRRSNSPMMLQHNPSSLEEVSSIITSMAHLTLVDDKCGYDAIDNVVSTDGGDSCGPFLVFQVVLPNRMTLHSEGPIQLQTTSSCVAVPVVDGELKRTFLRLELRGDRYILRSGVVVTNSLSMPIQVVSGDGARSLLAGQSKSEGLAPNSVGKLPIGFPSAKAALDMASALPLRIRARDGAQSSTVFSAGVPTLSTMLSCAEGHLVHIFSIRRLVTMTTPEVVVEPLWHIRNDHPSLALCLRRVGLDDNDVLIPPASTIPLVTFAASHAADPQIQISFQISGTAMFEWSQTIPLASLAGSSAPVVVKHNFAHPDVRHVPIAMMTALLSPDIPERFCCLNLAMNRKGPAMTLHVNVSNEYLPIVIENRTNESISFQQTGQRELYVVRPREDAPFAWSTFSMESRRVTLHLTCPKQKKYQVVLDVFKESASTEVRKIADRLFLNCSHDVARRRIFISVVQDRHLESSFIQQSNVVFNVGMFVRRCSMFVAGPCVSGALAQRTHNPVVDALAAVEGLDGDDHAKDLLRTYLASGNSEIDLVLVVLDHLSAKLTTNGNYHLAGASCGSVVISDCSLPNPLHPVILRCGSGDADEGAVEVRAHFLSPQIVGEKKAFAFKALQVTVSPVHICLSDAFLFILQEAALSIQQVMRRPPSESQKEAESSANDSTAPLSVACHVEKMWISNISLVLTLSRRSDGQYNPFSVIPLGNLLVQSVEAAPITLGEIIAVDALKSASSVTDALAQLVLPTYRTHVVMQLYKIIGSLEILGNPVMFASNVTAGVREFVVQTIHMHPLHGMSSLFSAATSGALHSVALLSRIGGRTIATVSFDDEWLSQREQEQTEPTSRKGRRGIFTGLASGIAGGVTGVIMRPMQGARSSGFVGFCSGVATGIIGIVGRPLAGTLDGIGNTAEFAAVALRPAPVAALEASSEASQVDLDSVPPRNFRSDSHLRAFVRSITSTAASPTQGPILTRPRAPSPRQAGISLTDVVFCGQRAFAAHLQQVHGDKRQLMDLLGAHNVARYTSWSDFASVATPQEFYDGVHIAIERVYAELIGQMLEQRLRKRSATTSRTKIQNNTAVGNDDVNSTCATLRNQQLLVVERIHNIKHSLGIRDLLKYVTVHQFVQFCSLAEIKNCFSLDEFQNRIGPFLLESARETAASLFSGTE